MAAVCCCGGHTGCACDRISVAADPCGCVSRGRDTGHQLFRLCAPAVLLLVGQPLYRTFTGYFWWLLVCGGGVGAVEMQMFSREACFLDTHLAIDMLHHASHSITRETLGPYKAKVIGIPCVYFISDVVCGCTAHHRVVLAVCTCECSYINCIHTHTVSLCTRTISLYTYALDILICRHTHS